MYVYLFSLMQLDQLYVYFFFFNDTATTEIYTLSLHDALPIYMVRHALNQVRRQTSSEGGAGEHWVRRANRGKKRRPGHVDRKSTRLNSSHSNISYAVFCLKKKKKN